MRSESRPCLTPKTLHSQPNFPPPRASSGSGWSMACSKARHSTSGWLRETYDGLAIQPLYPRDAAARPVAARAPGAAWTVMQRVDHPDPAAANEQALHDLENGATGLTLVCKGSVNANGYGLDASLETLERVLDGVYLDAGVAHRLQRQRRDARRRKELRRAGAEPRHRARNGRDARRAQSARRHGGDRYCARRGASLRPSSRSWCRNSPAKVSAGPFAVADGRVIHNAGGSEAQELAFALASAVTYLRALEAARHRARCGAAHDLFPPRGGCRPVSHDREIPRIAKALGAGRAGLRPCARADFRRGRDRVAHDDAARSLREYPALDRRGVRRRPRRRGRDHGAAFYRGARPARPLRAARRAQHAADPAGGIEPREGERSCGRLRRRSRM